MLIGIIPQGVISSVSKAWGGCTSGRKLTEECGILKKLVPGNVVLADCGFGIADCTAIYCRVEWR